MVSSKIKDLMIFDNKVFISLYYFSMASNRTFNLFLFSSRINNVNENNKKEFTARLTDLVLRRSSRNIDNNKDGNI
ncbi:hypothetical protein PPL_01208 [Heterostelium album PN500]|uniref:Uncharacterized protein n=1 Tax=Heterostelium pallidum (strain ATCC 26659 / Pp 5 / PN500) TaxID=670386 RepID=D3AYE8_HETP5|nr:hypothetical protein PPL_01208 [Heterostelium album PN500]EFA85975.1 hypothetical protein PPL_01208 [Heterostelium album PN500]|eukprot:XP_020438081.1 hypothetical protein PPL_01208 [Heterostelium album PN500]